MANQNKALLYGLYDDESDLIKAIKEAKSAHMEIDEVYSPFPVHGVDEALGLAESRLHVAGFVYGAIGTLTAFLFMSWVFTRDWPVIFGGKPYWSVPAFIPITFELTVLFAAVGMVVTFYTVCGLGPGVKEKVVDDRITDDKFCITFNTNGLDDQGIDKFKNFFQQTGASFVSTKTI